MSLGDLIYVLFIVFAIGRFLMQRRERKQEQQDLSQNRSGHPAGSPSAQETKGRWEEGWEDEWDEEDADERRKSPGELRKRQAREESAREEPQSREKSSSPRDVITQMAEELGIFFPEGSTPPPMPDPNPSTELEEIRETAKRERKTIIESRLDSSEKSKGKSTQSLPSAPLPAVKRGAYDIKVHKSRRLLRELKGNLSRPDGLAKAMLLKAILDPAPSARPRKTSSRHGR